MFKFFIKIVAWIAGFVIVPILSALGLSKGFGWDYKTILFYSAAFYIICFFVAFISYVIKDYIKKEVYRLLVDENIIKNQKKKDKK